MSDNKSNNHELHIISRYLGILTSKYIVFLLLVLTLYPMNVIPGYILLAGIVFPAALKFAIYDNSADSKMMTTISKISLFIQQPKNINLHIQNTAVNLIILYL